MPKYNTGSLVSVPQCTVKSHKVLRELVWDVCTTSRVIMIQAGGEIGFLETARKSLLMLGGTKVGS